MSDTPAEQVNAINRAFADTIAAKDAEIRRLGEELEDYKESLAMEVGENVRIFEAMGLTTNESFGHDTATGAIIRVYNAMKERANAAESKLAAMETRVGEMKPDLFWDSEDAEDCIGEPTEYTAFDDLDIGTTIKFDAAIRVPPVYYTSEADGDGIKVRPATPEEVEGYKKDREADRKRRAAEMKERNDIAAGHARVVCARCIRSPSLCTCGTIAAAIAGAGEAQAAAAARKEGE